MYERKGEIFQLPKKSSDRMDGLEKLERVQRTVSLLNSAGISEADNSDSERFLADFTSFLLMQTCGGGLDVASKCQLISKHLSKISSLLIEGAPQCEGQGYNQIENDVKLYNGDDKANLDPAQWSFTSDVAVVGIDAITRSNSTLEDFCRSYFMFHEMEANKPQSIFRYLPILSFTESYIYQLDGLNEKLLQLPKGGDPILNRQFEDKYQNLGAKSLRMLGKDPFRPLVGELESRGLLTERIAEELKCGEEYWALERKLCCALVDNEQISIEEVKRAIHLKSFDYRVLNLLLYQLRGETVNELHMEFLSISELLVEVSDDLFDYEDDVVENSFNVLRMFVKFYGGSTAPVMMAKFITEAEEKYDQILKELDPKLSTEYKKRCEEATKEGGKKSGPSLGTWHIPPVIVDEIRYRTSFSTSVDCL